MRLFQISALALVCMISSSCVATDTPKKKARAKLPGEELDTKPWGRATRDSQISSPLGLPSSQR